MRGKPHILAALLALALALLLSGCAGGDTVERFAPAAPSDGASIAVPGYETIPLKAGEKAQAVYFTNPPENACTFVLSLTPDDAGEPLWTGEAISPGEAFTHITLKRALAAGEYAATLRYDCFSLQDGAPLNGAEIKVTLSVT